jgi:hypothetical protein
MGQFGPVSSLAIFDFTGNAATVIMVKNRDMPTKLSA